MQTEATPTCPAHKTGGPLKTTSYRGMSGARHRSPPTNQFPANRHDSTYEHGLAGSFQAWAFWWRIEHDAKPEQKAHTSLTLVFEMSRFLNASNDPNEGGRIPSDLICLSFPDSTIIPENLLNAIASFALGSPDMERLLKCTTLPNVVDSVPRS